MLCQRRHSQAWRKSPAFCGDDVVIHEGSLSTLKRFKDDVREVQQNYECGMSFESYNDLKVGDIIECFDVEEIAPEL